MEIGIPHRLQHMLLRCKMQNRNDSFYCVLVSIHQYTSYTCITANDLKIVRLLRRCASKLPATMTDSTRMTIARRIILTSFRDSSPPLMRMLMTMLLMLMTLLQQLQCGLVAHIYRLTTTLYDSQLVQFTAPFNEK